MELSEEGTEDWAKASASTFDTLKTLDCHEVPKPEWWNDEGLKALSARVVALVSDEAVSCAMRARILCGGALSKAPWNVGLRTAAEIKEAATWYRRGAMVTLISADKQLDEELASECDAVADPLLAKEEAETTEARAAAEAEAAEALKLAEAKAAAAAKELLADEENEKQAASTKAAKVKQSKGKQSKGKQGMGKR